MSAAKRLRRCCWVKCRCVQQINFWCYSHWHALGEPLQLKFLHTEVGSAAREEVMKEIRAHEVATRRWLREKVTGTGLRPKE